MSVKKLIIPFCFLIGLAHPVCGLSPASVRMLSSLTVQEEKSLQPVFEMAADFFDQYPQWADAHAEAKLLVMVRHGESYSNMFRFVQSYTHFSPLTMQGLTQRNGLTAFLASYGIAFDRFLASDLERSYQTLEKVAQNAPSLPF